MMALDGVTGQIESRMFTELSHRQENFGPSPVRNAGSGAMRVAASP
jgi:hypothetical protein